MTQEEIIKRHTKYAKGAISNWKFYNLGRTQWPTLDLFQKHLDAELTQKLAAIQKPPEASKVESAPPTQVQPQQQASPPDKTAEPQPLVDSGRPEVLPTAVEAAQSSLQARPAWAADALRDDWYCQYPGMTVYLRQFQIKHTKDVYETLKSEAAYLLLAPTGTGKTYMACYYIKRAIEEQLFEGKSVAPWTFLIVTKARVVEQFYRVARYQFGIPMDKCIVTSYDALRSSLGKQYLQEYTEIVGGEPVVKFRWMNWIYPLCIIWDECHALKNKDSQQSKIGQAYNDIVSNHTRQLFMSATPFTRIADTRCYVVACKQEMSRLIIKAYA